MSLRQSGFVARSWGAVVSVCLVISLILPPAARAAEVAPDLEYQVKAAFLLNFIKFVDWPRTESAALGSSFDICILGENPFGRFLDQMLDGERLQGRRLTAKRVTRPLPASCRVLFFEKAARDVSSILSSVDPGVLTVGEGADFLRDGGMIAFVIENHRVRFDVNQSAALRAGLQISSKLLNIARSVER